MNRAPLAQARRFSEADRHLGPYVPTLVADWLRDFPERRHRVIDCTLTFADISGFTRLTELLGARGKIGAEEMAELINGTFDALLEPAYAYGAGLIKWGGDATLLFFEGPQHAQRAARAAHEMQRVMRTVGGLRTSRGPVRLRISVGIHSDRYDVFLIGEDDHRELILAGRPTTVLTQLEKDAAAGQIVISHATAAALSAAGAPPPTAPAGRGLLLSAPPEADLCDPTPGIEDHARTDIGVALCRLLREHIRSGGIDSEHRQVTVGFLKMSGTDELLREHGPEALESAMAHVIRATQRAAAANDVTFLATDIAEDGVKVMLSAGAPRRSGQDEDRMIATLRTAIDAGGVLPLRGGVTTGRSFAADFGPPYRRTYSVMGDCVNLAARLVERAEPGELLTVQSLIDAARGDFVVTEKPAFAAKGKRVPVRPFSLSTPDSATQASVLAANEREPMLGRGAQLATLLSAAEQAATGSGRTAEVVGEPGMGKSTLLAELQAAAEADMVWTDGDVYAVARPYAPFERVLRSCMALASGTPADSLVGPLETAVRELAPELLPWLPLIGIAAGVPISSTPEVEQIDAAHRKGKLEEVTSELLGSVFNQPTVLIFNDVHLMDDASRDLISRLAQDTSERPWLVIISRRPENDSPLVAEPDERIELGPLDDGAAAELLHRATASSPLPPHRLAELARRANGNPLFLRELAAGLRAGDALDMLPRSVEAAIAARVDRLATPERRALRAAAVLGLDVDHVLLQELLSEEQPESQVAVAERLAALTEFLEPMGGGIHRFSHQLVREVAYESLPYRRRTMLHARAAAALELSLGQDPSEQAELLSLHCLQGARYGDAWRYARLAADRARQRYAAVEAAESYRQALTAAGHVADIDPHELAQVDEALGELYVELGEMTAAETALRRGLRRTGGQSLAAARLQLNLARLRDIEGRHAAAMRWAIRAQRTIADSSGPDARIVQGQLAARRARILYRQGRHREAQRLAADAAQLARDSENLRTLAEALEYGDLAAVELGVESGAGAEQALAIYQALGALGDEARVHNTLGMLAYHRGAWADALRHYRAAEDAYLRCGKRWDGATAMANAAELLVDQAHYEEAEAALQQARLIYRGVGAAAEVAFVDNQLGRAAARRGQTAEALELFQSARKQFLASGETTEVALVDACIAEAHCMGGAYDTALQLAEAALSTRRSRGAVAAFHPLLHRVRGQRAAQIGPTAGGSSVAASLAGRSPSSRRAA